MGIIEPGPALDALVARTLGWAKVKEVGGRVWGVPPASKYGSNEWTPQWSTNPGAALGLLVEENRKGVGLSLIHDEGKYACVPASEKVVNLEAVFRVGLDQWSHTPEVAICVGILRAHGVDVEAALKEAL